MPYATAAQMKQRYDHRRVGQLVRDDGTQASSSDLDADAVLAELLADASGMIDSAVLRGGRYSQADLAGLTGANSKFLVRLTCDICYGLLVQRRGYTGAELNSLAPSYEAAMKALDRLAGGELVFNIDRNVLAGKPRRVVLSYDRQLVSATTRLFGNLTLRPGNPGDPQPTE